MAPSAAHQQALNHTANICRLAAMAVKEVGVQALVVNANLPALRARLNLLFAEYETEWTSWLALVLRSKTVDALLTHFDDTKKCFEWIRLLIGDDDNHQAEHYEHTKIRTIFDEITTQPSAHDRSSLENLFFGLRNCVAKLTILVPENKIAHHLTIGYIEPLLDDTSLQRWKQTQSLKSYESIMMFIENRCSQLDQQLTQAPVCKLCGTERHWPFKCEIFRRMALPLRNEFVFRNGLCTNCFSENHSTVDCARPECPRCYIRHNSALCTKNRNLEL